MFHMKSVGCACHVTQSSQVLVSSRQFAGFPPNPIGNFVAMAADGKPIGFGVSAESRGKAESRLWEAF